MSVSKAILDALGYIGPMTGAEISQEINYPIRRTHGITQRLRKELPKRPKRIYVKDYVFDDDGARRYPRPVFALGDLPDKPKPKSDPKEIRARYEAKKKLKVNSVWMLGWSREKRREHGKRI